MVPWYGAHIQPIIPPPISVNLLHHAQLNIPPQKSSFLFFKLPPLQYEPDIHAILTYIPSTH